MALSLSTATDFALATLGLMRYQDTPSAEDQITVEILNTIIHSEKGIEGRPLQIKHAVSFSVVTNSVLALLAAGIIKASYKEGNDESLARWNVPGAIDLDMHGFYDPMIFGRVTFTVDCNFPSVVEGLLGTNLPNGGSYQNRRQDVMGANMVELISLPFHEQFYRHRDNKVLLSILHDTTVLPVSSSCRNHRMVGMLHQVMYRFSEKPPTVEELTNPGFYGTKIEYLRDLSTLVRNGYLDKVMYDDMDEVLVLSSALLVDLAMADYREPEEDYRDVRSFKVPREPGSPEDQGIRKMIYRAILDAVPNSELERILYSMARSGMKGNNDYYLGNPKWNLYRQRARREMIVYLIEMKIFRMHADAIGLIPMLAEDLMFYANSIKNKQGRN